LFIEKVYLYLQKKITTKTDIMLSDSITERALDLVINQGLDILKAVEEAIKEEQNFINELLEQKSERSVKLKNAMRSKVYATILTNDANETIKNL